MSFARGLGLDPFRALGLRRGASARDVKRAYAKRLKNKRPDDDPAAFIALREAFEAARRIAENDERNAAMRTEAAEREAVSAAPEDHAAAPGMSPGDAATDGPSATELPDEDEEDDDTEREVHEARRRARAAARVRHEQLRSMRRRFHAWCDGRSHDGGAADAEALFSDLAWHATTAETRIFAAEVLEAMEEDADWFADATAWDAPDPSNGRDAHDPYDVERPEWLDDAAILALYAYFAPHEAPGHMDETDGERPWVARRANAWAVLAEPVLMDAGVISEPLPRYDFDALRIAWIEGANADDHGSYFDRDAREWVDMAPVPRAVREIGALLKAGPGQGRTNAIAAVLDRDALAGLDAYQALERALRRWLVAETSGEWLAEKGRPRMLVMQWLDVEVIDLMDARFGWRDHFGGQHEAQQFDHLHRLIDELRGVGPGGFGTPAAAASSAAWTGRSGYAVPKPTVGPERMPVWMRGSVLLGGYAVLRLAALPAGWW